LAKTLTDIDKIAQLVQFAKYKSTKLFRYYVRLPHKIKAAFTGNQGFKTSATAFQYVLRILGTHPVAKFNVLYFECEQRAELFKKTEDHEIYRELKAKFLENHKSVDSATFNISKRPTDNICPECGGKILIHKRKTRIFRFASETLPTEKGVIEGDTIQSAEINNTQYPEFKKWLPPFLIKKDITVRNTALTILDPNGNKMFGDLKYVGADIMVEFVSYNQSVQAGAGVQRLSVWEDEEPPLDFHEEQLPRLLGEDGDVIITVTPANGMTWTFDDIFEKAKLYLRTPIICKYYLEEEDTVVKEIEHTDSDHDIAVVQAATDDNPTLSPDVVDAMYNEMPDLDGTAIATRRYGIFKQATGRIFKDMNYKVHVIDPRAYGIGPEYINGLVLGRTFDFHPANPHAIIWAGLSSTDELFVYREWMPSPDKWVISRLCREMGRMSNHEKYVVNFIDPLANTPNQETGKTTVELMNEAFLQLKKDGLGTGGYWEPFNTKGEVGRDAIKERLANSLKVERPFNNKVTEDGKTRQLPTIWIFKDCRETARSLKQWRLESWASNRQLATRDRKEKHAEKWSHFCTALEGLLKDKRFRPRRESVKPAQREYRRFQGGRR
jgi:phage terminase large subunit-like protein/DNA-directed RNA polymerase subunit RPC12/RpoP